jgi:hypothetical protein
MGMKVETYGVRETLAELRKYERETFTRISKDLKLSAEPLQGLLVQSSLMSRWERTGTHLVGVKGNQKCPHIRVLQRRKV